jgi:hypothetical protein
VANNIFSYDLTGAAPGLSQHAVFVSSPPWLSAYGRFIDNIIVATSGSREGSAWFATVPPAQFDSNDLYVFGPPTAGTTLYNEWSSGEVIDEQSRGHGNLSVEPGFASGGRVIGPRSKLIDRGTPEDAPHDDIAGHPRPSGAAPDIGNWEVW